MPRNLRSTPQQHTTVIFESRTTVSRYLTDQFFDMCVKTNEPKECPVCLEDWLSCKRCACLLQCGHVIHGACLLAMKDPKCPVCRDPDVY